MDLTGDEHEERLVLIVEEEMVVVEDMDLWCVCGELGRGVGFLGVRGLIESGLEKLGILRILR